MSYKFESKFTIGEYIKIDGCGELRAVITAVLWRSDRAQYEVSWISGSSHTAWIEEWRLSL